QMKTCVSFEDLLEIHRPQIHEMQRFGASIANSTTVEASQTLGNYIRMLEGTLRQTYREAAALAKRTDDLHEIAEIWRGMSLFCGLALEALASLKEPQLYDLALDY